MNGQDMKAQLDEVEQQLDFATVDDLPDVDPEAMAKLQAALEATPDQLPSELPKQDTDSKSLVRRFAAKYGIPPRSLLPMLRATAFKDAKTVHQLQALLIVAEQYELNPWTKELFAFDDKKGGVIPVVSVDGWARIINGNPMLDGIQFAYSDEVRYPPESMAKDDPRAPKPCPAWIECHLYRKDRTHPTKVREFFDECYREATYSRQYQKYFPGPWQTHTGRMLRHKALIQCARVTFGYAGIYDIDEANRILEGVVVAKRVEDATPVSAQRSAAARLDQFAGEPAKQEEFDASDIDDEETHNHESYRSEPEF